MKNIEVEKGIPVPAARAPWGHFRRAISNLEIGDSFWTNESTRNNLYRSAQQAGVKIRTAKQQKGAKQGFRVWRVA